MKKDERERRGPARASRAAAVSLASSLACVTWLTWMGAGTASAQSPMLAKQEVVVLQGGTVHVGNGDVIEPDGDDLFGLRELLTAKTAARP